MKSANEVEDAKNGVVPRAIVEQIEPKFLAQEKVIAFVQLDINQNREFDSIHLVLTNRRLFEVKHGENPRVWDIGENTAIRSSVFSGLGNVVLLDGKEALSKWAFTAARAAEVANLMILANSIAQNRIEKDQQLRPEVQPTAAPSPIKSLLRLSRFMSGKLKLTLLGVVLTLLATAAGLIWPYLTKPLTDEVLVPWFDGKSVVSNGQFLAQVTPYLLGMLGAAFLAWALGWARTYVMSLLSEQISCNLRNETYRHLQKLSLDFYGSRRTGDLISRIGTDTDRICNFLSSNLLDFVTDVLMIVFTSIILFFHNPWLAFVALVPFPIIAWMTHQVRVLLRHGFARAGHAWESMVSVLTDAIPGARVVKAFAQEQREISRFEEANKHVFDSNVRINKLWAFFGPAVALLTDLGLLLIWGYGAWLIAAQSISLGELQLFTIYIGKFYLRLDSMSRMLAETQRAAAATFRVFEILDQIPSVMEPKQPVDPGKLKGELELRGVRFRYNNREVISGVDLKIRPGELIGLVGPSGSGKSTLVNLVCRFYDVTEGALFIDGHDIRAFPIEKFRRNIGIVLQEPFLFFGTIAENIAYGRPDASPSEIIAAARAANAHGFISKLPDGYESVVGERGQGLSGGERQRISIARAILTDPRLLILDEATSAVDNETEREIQAALDNLVKGRTTIAIAHRLSTLRNADRIVVMDRGVVVEIGKHDELLARGGVYTRLHQAQMAVIQ